MCRTCKAENPKWSKGVRVPVKDLPLFFASQPSWNFEQKIYGHNVVVTERARPTLTGRLGCHDIEGVVHRRQDHFLVREIFHCPGKKYNCSPRLTCTGRRRHCYGLCKVTVYSANKDVAVVQFAGTHGTGTLQRRVWPCNTFGAQPDESPPRDMSKKESKMRAIFGSPSKDELHWQDLKKTKERENLSAFKQPSIKQENHIHFKEDVDYNEHQMYPRVQIQAPQAQLYQQQQYGTNMLYPSPPIMEQDQLMTPEMSPEERLKQQHQATTSHQLSSSSYPFYPSNSMGQGCQVAPSPNFWSNPGMLINYFPMTPPSNNKTEMMVEDERLPPINFVPNRDIQNKTKKGVFDNDYIPTLSEVNCRDECDQSVGGGFSPFDLSPNQGEPFGKRRKMDSGNSQNMHNNSMLNGGDIWRPYLHHQDFDGGLKLDQTLTSPVQNISPDQNQNQDNFISFMLKGDENSHFYRDSQKLLANMSSGLQLTKL